MTAIVVTKVERVESPDCATLLEFGSATIHEALGQTNLLPRHLLPLDPTKTACGPAVTVLTVAGDNLPVHIAVEQCRYGDILVVGTIGEGYAGLIGELLATALVKRGCAGVVLDGCYRDSAALIELGLPMWARGAWAQAPRKEHLGQVNSPIAIGGVMIAPGDAIIADRDGVTVVPRTGVKETIIAARKRSQHELETRARLIAGEVSLDIYKMRETLSQRGLKYL